MTPMQSTDLKAERLAKHREARAILARAQKAGRDLTAGERRDLDGLLDRIDQLDQDAIDVEARAVTPTTDRSNFYESKNTMSSNDDLATFLRSGTGTRQVAYVPREQRTMTTASANDVVPRDFSRELWRLLEDTAPMLRFGRIFATDGGNPLDVPVVASFGSAVAVAEGSAIAGTDPTFDVVSLGAHKVGQLVQASRELLADARVNVEGFLAEAMARNIDQVVGPWLTLGTGSTEPLGYVTAAGSAVVTGGTGLAGRPSYADLVGLYGELHYKYRRNAAWLVSDSAAVALRKITDTTGRPIWEPSSQVGQPEQLLGHPVIVDPYLPTLGTAVTGSIVFGDPRAYAVRIADGGINIEASREYAFEQDLVTFRGVLRLDAAPLADDAFVTYRGGTA
jgi:HK97 family phage major capsid protein